MIIIIIIIIIVIILIEKTTKRQFSLVDRTTYLKVNNLVKPLKCCIVTYPSRNKNHLASQVS